MPRIQSPSGSGTSAWEVEFPGATVRKSDNLIRQHRAGKAGIEYAAAQVYAARERVVRRERERARSGFGQPGRAGNHVADGDVLSISQRIDRKRRRSAGQSNCVAAEEPTGRSRRDFGITENKIADRSRIDHVNRRVARQVDGAEIGRVPPSATMPPCQLAVLALLQSAVPDVSFQVPLAAHVVDAALIKRVNANAASRFIICSNMMSLQESTGPWSVLRRPDKQGRTGRDLMAAQFQAGLDDKLPLVP